MATPPRTLETMMAELVHHMAQLSAAQKETNHYLAELLKATTKR
jgi:hypothetical protein